MVFAILKYSHSCFSVTCYMYGIHGCIDHVRKTHTSLLPHIREITIASCLQLHFYLSSLEKEGNKRVLIAY